MRASHTWSRTSPTKPPYAQKARAVETARNRLRSDQRFPRWGAALSHEPRLRPTGAPFTGSRQPPLPQRADVARGLGTETRPPLHFGHRRQVSEPVPPGAPGRRDGGLRRPFGSKAASPTSRIRGRGRDFRCLVRSGSRKAGAPQDLAWPRTVALRGSGCGAGWSAKWWTRGLTSRKGRPSPPSAGLGPRTRVSMAAAGGAGGGGGGARTPPERRSRGIWRVPPLARRVTPPAASRDTRASPSSRSKAGGAARPRRPQGPRLLQNHVSPLSRVPLKARILPTPSLASLAGAQEMLKQVSVKLLKKRKKDHPCLLEQ